MSKFLRILLQLPAVLQMQSLIVGRAQPCPSCKAAQHLQPASLPRSPEQLLLSFPRAYSLTLQPVAQGQHHPSFPYPAAHFSSTSSYQEMESSLQLQPTQPPEVFLPRETITMAQAKILSLPDEGSLATLIANGLRKPVTISLFIIQLVS